MKSLLILSSILLFMNQMTAQIDPEPEVYQSSGKTNYFSVEKVKDRWFFITPNDQPFFSLGVTHSKECIKLDELNLFNTRYNGDEKELSKVFLDHFERFRFNSSGYGPLPEMEKHIPYVIEVWTIGPRSLSAGERSKNADIFDPATKEKIEENISKTVSRHIDNPLCMGYVGIDLPLWVVRPKNGPSYLDFYRHLDNESPGKKIYLDFLKEKYHSDLEALKKAYSIDINALDELKDKNFAEQYPISNEVVARDDLEFLGLIAEEYFACVSKIFRESDPNHLYLGDRFMAIADSGRPFLKVPDEILITASKYVDVVSFQPMGSKIKVGEYLDHVHSITGLPILLADVNTFLSRPKEGQENTEDYETEAGENTRDFYMDAISCDALIGIHRCTVRDYRPWDTNYHRRGILRKDDTPYPVLEKYITETNKLVYDAVYKKLN